jgi:hypothetical protein
MIFFFHQLILPRIGPVLDDLLGVNLANTWQDLQFVLGRRIEVQGGLLGRGLGRLFGFRLRWFLRGLGVDGRGKRAQSKHGDDQRRDQLQHSGLLSTDGVLD